MGILHSFLTSATTTYPTRYVPFEKTMRKLLLTMGIISQLLGLFGCKNDKTDKHTTQGEETVQTVNPNDILYTTPTLENALPDFEDKTETSNLRFHEDEWRQIEFISKGQKASINTEIEKIKDVYDNHTHKGGSYTAFKKVAVRELITQPLTVDFAKLKSYFTDNDLELVGVSLDNHLGQVKSGFSFTIDGITYYGLLDGNNNVITFCIYSADSQESLKASADNLSYILETENLYLVDWRAMNVFDESNIKTDLVKE